jgi:hypothetical protein
VQQLQQTTGQDYAVRIVSAIQAIGRDCKNVR